MALAVEDADDVPAIAGELDRAADVAVGESIDEGRADDDLVAAGDEHAPARAHLGVLPDRESGRAGAAYRDVGAAAVLALEVERCVDLGL